MKLLFIVDPLAGLKPYKDSSVAMMRAAMARGHAVFAVEAGQLMVKDGIARADCAWLDVRADADWYRVTRTDNLALTDFDAVLMRTDPPVDTDYLLATHLLVIAGATEIGHFLADHHDVIVKPLTEMGGSGVFRLTRTDPNRNAVLETLTRRGRRVIMAQRYLPAIADGDKRILLIAGEVVPWALARIPLAGETRGNLAAGGTARAQPLSARDREIAEAIAP